MENRYISFTFDDGFIKGAKKIDKILHPYKATFYITTGWVKPNNTPILDAYNHGIDHGTIDDWKELSRKGHDIGSHSVTHKSLKYLNITKEELEKEYKEALNFIKSIHNGPYSLAFPHNYNMDLNVKHDSIRVGHGRIIYNKLEKINLQKIICWSPWINPITEENEQKIYKKILKVPANSWIVLSLHSIDGEGWQPWSSESLRRLKDFVIKVNYKIKTMAEMTSILKE